MPLHSSASLVARSEGPLRIAICEALVQPGLALCRAAAMKAGVALNASRR